MKKKPSLQLLTECLKNDYGIQAASLVPLNLGADRDAWSYQAQTPDRSAYFVKLKRGHDHDMSAVLLSLLDEAGIQEIIPPVKTCHNRATQRIDHFTLIVYPFVEGSDGFSTTLTDDQWTGLGRVLRQVHEFTVPKSIEKQIRREIYSSQWREYVRALDLNTATHGDDAASMLHRFLKEHLEIIHHLVEEAEKLSRKVKDLSPKFVLCHSDIHGGNVLIDKNGFIYIVDWDGPIMAPKERDLMFIGGGIANVWNNPHEEEWFYKGYGAVEINRLILAYYRHERIVEDIAEYVQELLFNPVSHKNRLEMLKQFTDMFKPRGVVDIAFKTENSL